MENQHNIAYVTLLLALIAGYCDTVTFVAAESLFSAHVTGNFIVFAYQIIKGSELSAWVKLLTFPVFIIAVIIGGRIGSTPEKRYKLLLWEGIMLSLAGIAAWYWNTDSSGDKAIMYTISMTVVVAMGLQNAFGKLFAKETHGPTTMMTGNVTQASLDMGTLLKTGFSDVAASVSLKKQLVTITGFLVGCMLGAVAGKLWGLITVVLPGIALLLCYFSTKTKAA